MAKRKTPVRKSRQKSKSSSGLLSWIAVLALTVGGISAYEHRAKLFPAKQEKQTASLAKPKNQSSTKPVTAPKVASPAAPAVTRPAERPKAQDAKLVPPMPIKQASSIPAVSGIVTAAIPANRPLNEQAPAIGLDAGGDTRVVPNKQQFSFCGRSGLKNCVVDGRIFWRDGKKQVLAGIIVPRTDEAGCVEERRKGFAAKARLREFLNAGEFSQSTQENQVSLSRGGQRFEALLFRDGLARPITQKNQSWCG